MNIELSNQEVRFLERYGNILRVKEDGTYYYMPLYFKRIKDNSFTIVQFEKLPKKVIDFIEEERKTSTLYQKPLTPKECYKPQKVTPEDVKNQANTPGNIFVSTEAIKRQTLSDKKSCTQMIKLSEKTINKYKGNFFKLLKNIGFKKQL